ncbi:UNVERIFIED_CONTAM: hypothetical protein Sradi_3283000 [Sesamum radiatum]|uniref:Integrase catalytic domain-containing protein n=1 Tax=Sesamum radiatum TaxID=300843 RepID=A0AAW2R1L2_SESRA
MSNPQANRQVEVINRIILRHLKICLEGLKGNWVEELLGVLWAYHTTARNAMGETPFCLVYGSAAIIPMEIGEESARAKLYDQAKNAEQHEADLMFLSEKRELAYVKILRYKKQTEKMYNKNKTKNLSSGGLGLEKV